MEIEKKSMSWRIDLLMCLVSATALYFAAHLGGAINVLQQGELVGPDDFLRIHQVLNWLEGQGWYDLKAYRMAPPDGADIHWSRLVDLPIGLLVEFFQLFAGWQTAWRLATIAWPYIVYVLTLLALIRLTQHFTGKVSSIFILLFYAMSAVTITETAVGRIDHHNVQILLYALALLGFVEKICGNVLVTDVACDLFGDIAKEIKSRAATDSEQGVCFGEAAA